MDIEKNFNLSIYWIENWHKNLSELIWTRFFSNKRSIVSVPEQIFFKTHKNYSWFTNHTKNRPQEIRLIGPLYQPRSHLSLLVLPSLYLILNSVALCSGDKCHLKAHQYTDFSPFTWVTVMGQMWHDLTQRSRRESRMAPLDSGPGSVPSTSQCSPQLSATIRNQDSRFPFPTLSCLHNTTTLDKYSHARSYRWKKSIVTIFFDPLFLSPGWDLRI